METIFTLLLYGLVAVVGLLGIMAFIALLSRANELEGE